MLKPLIFLLVSALTAASAATAHEYWLSPHHAQVAVGEDIRADIRNGDRFRGPTFPFFPGQSARFDILRNGKTQRYSGTPGDHPAFQTSASEPGLWVLVHETAPSRITYASWADFEKFLTHKDMPQARARHVARGLPASGFSEVYTRHVKALIGVGSAEGADQRTGMETEFLALTNPYTEDLSEGVLVGLLYRNAPRADAQIELFQRAPDGTVSITIHRTDNRGLARLPVLPGHDYLLDAVVLRPASEEDPAVWETLWAAMTFSTPPR